MFAIRFVNIKFVACSTIASSFAVSLCTSLILVVYLAQELVCLKELVVNDISLIKVVPVSSHFYWSDVKSCRNAKQNNTQTWGQVAKLVIIKYEYTTKSFSLAVFDNRLMREERKFLMK